MPFWRRPQRGQAMTSSVRAGKTAGASRRAFKGGGCLAGAPALLRALCPLQLSHPRQGGDLLILGAVTSYGVRTDTGDVRQQEHCQQTDQLPQQAQQEAEPEGVALFPAITATEEADDCPGHDDQEGEIEASFASRFSEQT